MERDSSFHSPIQGQPNAAQMKETIEEQEILPLSAKVVAHLVVRVETVS